MTATANESSLDVAMDATDEIEALGAAWGEAIAHEAKLTAEKPLQKTAAILRLMQTANPLTNKQHSASSAEAVVEGDLLYADHLKLLRDAIVGTKTAEGRFHAAKVRAQLLAQRDGVR